MQYFSCRTWSQKRRTPEQRCLGSRTYSSLCSGPITLLGLAKSQQSVMTSFGKVICELKATELDFPSLVLKTGLYRQ
jgi:hypothetical protein